MNKKNIIGKRFSKLIVIKQSDHVLIGKEKRLAYLCKCDCGNEKIVLSRDLLGKKTKSCGCIKLRDISNQKFGQLTPLYPLKKPGVKGRGRIWHCKCDCGNIVDLPSQCIISGKNKTCGDKIKHDYQDNFYKEIPLVFFNRIVSQAKKRNILFDLSIEYLWNLYLSQNKKCTLTGIDLYFYNKDLKSKNRATGTNCSLDRINSNIGYIEGNVQWVFKRINMMKNILSNKEFIYYSNIIVNNYYFNNRPNWDEYFLNLAINVSYRSEDPNIKHGAIIVNEKNHICGTGYNGLITGAKNIVDLNNREEKRKYMIHAEENAMLNCFYKNDFMKMYITGNPCNNCLQRIINFGIKEIIILNRTGSILEDKNYLIMQKNILKNTCLKIKKISLKNVLLDI